MEESLQKIVESIQGISQELNQPNCFDKVSLYTTIISTIVALAAAIFTAKSACAAKKAAQASKESNKLQKEQIELQNRQNLFEIKSKNCTILKRYVRNFKKNKDNFSLIHFEEKIEKEELESMKKFVDMALPLLLSLIGREIDKNRITNPRLLNAPAFSSYVKESINEIEYAITEIPLLFSSKISKVSVRFLEQYSEFVTTLYNYNLVSEAERNGKKVSAQDELTIISLFSLTNDLLSSYKEIDEKNIMQEMENEINLKIKKEVAQNV